MELNILKDKRMFLGVFFYLVSITDNLETWLNCCCFLPILKLIANILSGNSRMVKTQEFYVFYNSVMQS